MEKKYDQQAYPIVEHGYIKEKGMLLIDQVAITAMQAITTAITIEVARTGKDASKINVVEHSWNIAKEFMEERENHVK